MEKKIRPYGVNVDIPAPELSDEEYSYVQNMVFRNDGAIRAEGYGNVIGALLDSPIYLLGNRRPGDEYFWLYPGANLSINVTDQQNHFDITPLGLIQADPGDWTGGALNNIAMLTNGINVPYFWDGITGNIMQPLPNFPPLTTCGFIRPFKYFAIAGDITVDGLTFENQFYWSASVEPGLPPQDWQPLPSNDAGDNILAATEGSIIDGRSIRDHFVLAKNHSLYLMNYVAGQFVFNINKLSVTTGALTSNCMTEYKSRMFIFADGDIISTDGSRIESIATHKVKRTIFSEMNQTYYQRCFASTYIVKDEIWFCYPTGSSEFCDKAAVYDLVRGSWGFRDLPQATHIAEGLVSDLGGLDWDTDDESWEEDATAWNETGLSEIADGLMMASAEDATGHMYGIDFLRDAAGETIPGYVEKASMDFGQLDRIKLIKQLWIYALGTPGDVLEVRVGTQQHESEPVAWGAVKQFIIGESSKIDVTEAGRLISIRIGGDLHNQWRVFSIEFRYDFQGRF